MAKKKVAPKPRRVARKRMARQVKAMLEDRGVSPYALIKETKIPGNTIYGFLAGRRNITTATLDRILDAAGIGSIEFRPRED